MVKPAMDASRAVVLVLGILIGSLSPSLRALSPAGPTPANIPGLFIDVTAAGNVHFTAVASHTSKKYLMETMGSGVALLDYDNDGLLDIFFVNGAPLSDPTAKGAIPQKASEKDWNRLYHQKK